MAEHHIVELLRKVARRANLKINGPHILRHTFCSHLATRGAPTRAIQDSPVIVDDSAVHAPESKRDVRCDPTAGGRSSNRKVCKHCGDFQELTDGMLQAVPGRNRARWQRAAGELPRA